MTMPFLRLWQRLFPRPLDEGPGSLGRRGEAAAASFLEKRGCRILARNWRHGRHEIDLVCLDGDVLVFAEVKTRSHKALVHGYAAVHHRKKKAIESAARGYLGQLDRKPRTFRFDIVEVQHEKGVITEVLHFANVPLFSKAFLRSA